MPLKRGTPLANVQASQVRRGNEGSAALERLLCDALYRPPNSPTAALPTGNRETQNRKQRDRGHGCTQWDHP